MKVYYVRVSSVDQKTDRQRINEKEFDLVVEDKCSGSIPFFEREGGKKIKQLLDKKIITSLSVWTIDRLGRDLLDILNSIQYLSERGIRIHFIQQGLISLDNEGKENPISKMIISILGIVAEMERSQIKERQKEGIELAKLRGVYKGRVNGSIEDLRTFLSKPKIAKTIEKYLGFYVPVLEHNNR